jgi:hypothetical protein
VALAAILRESRLYMVWISRAIVGSQMARHARVRQSIINVVFMARGAQHAGMGAGQRERGRAVIERGSSPGGRRIVARRTLLRESGRRMVRVRDAVVVGQMRDTHVRRAGINMAYARWYGRRSAGV